MRPGTKGLYPVVPFERVRDEKDSTPSHKEGTRTYKRTYQRVSRNKGLRAQPFCHECAYLALPLPEVMSKDSSGEA